MKPHTQPPGAVGLYDPRFEHDACGVGMVARLDNTPTHEVVRRAITALENLEHRGAAGADPRTGDGAGILMQIPDEFLRAVVDFELPPAGQYGVLVCFLPTNELARTKLEDLLELNVRVEGQRVLGWRDVPVDESHVGDTANQSRPIMRQLFVGAEGDYAADQDAFERKLYVIRRICEIAAGPALYVASSSSRTINYKGMLISYQLAGFYPDLADERVKSALALVHSRFSTNTFPSWELAHPYRVICHNGEINTVMGNINWMRARESELASDLFGRDLAKILPIVRPGGSDSATFDNVLELLMLAGRSLPHAVMMMIPEAYKGREDLSEELRGFYAFHSCLMEPWDGPAAVAFTDGRVVGATLDRNGLRPGTLGAHHRRARRAWLGGGNARLRGGRAGDPARAGAATRAPAARQAVPGRPRAGPDRGRRRDQAPDRHPAALRRLVRAQQRALQPAAAVRSGDALRPAAAHSSARVRLYAGGPARADRADGARRRRADRLDGQRPGRWPCSPTRRRPCSPTSSSCSRR